jgi:indolepyruvate ferredoxin oxidoreductase
VVTVGALIAMAAHLEGKSASVLDFMGFAQKGGAVLSFVRLAENASALNQVRIDAQQADAVLACDIVVAATPEALATVRHGRTKVLANLHEIRSPNRCATRTPTCRSTAAREACVRGRRRSGRDARCAGARRGLSRRLDRVEHRCDGLCVAARSGACRPAGVAACDRVERRCGREQPEGVLARPPRRRRPGACREMLHEPDPATLHADSVDELVERGVRHLTAYQDARYAERYRALVEATRAAEAALPDRAPRTRH